MINEILTVLDPEEGTEATEPTAQMTEGEDAPVETPAADEPAEEGESTEAPATEEAGM
ncbi:MAG: hypothetical protein Q8P39_00365 [Candidatus Yanofskybacteria bacterium]|nr:hypothetical protein [Candidatus Yanofskybacteria bacterium]